MTREHIIEEKKDGFFPVRINLTEFPSIKNNKIIQTKKEGCDQKFSILFSLVLVIVNLIL